MHTGNTQEFRKDDVSYFWTNEAQKALLDKYLLSSSDLTSIVNVNKHAFNGDQSVENFENLIQKNFKKNGCSPEYGFLVVEHEEGPMVDTAQEHGLGTMKFDRFYTIFQNSLSTGLI